MEIYFYNQGLKETQVNTNMKKLMENNIYKQGLNVNHFNINMEKNKMNKKINDKIFNKKYKFYI